MGWLNGNGSRRSLWSYIRKTHRPFRRPRYGGLRFAVVHCWPSLHVSSSQSLSDIPDVWGNLRDWFQLCLHCHVRDRTPVFRQTSFPGHWADSNGYWSRIGGDEPYLPRFADGVWLEGGFQRTVFIVFFLGWALDPNVASEKTDEAFEESEKSQVRQKRGMLDFSMWRNNTYVVLNITAFIVYTGHIMPPLHFVSISSIRAVFQIPNEYRKTGKTKLLKFLKLL